MSASAAAVQTAPPNYVAIKEKQQATWSAGDYGRIGVTLQISGEQLCEALDLPAGARVLDVAAGNGNASLAAARRFCDVVSTDYVPALLVQGKARAQAEGFELEFRSADAENLPFDDASFDYVVSTFGVMFTPDQAQAASELVRVCRPGGAIGLASWTPESFIGELFRTIGKHVPPPAGLDSPARWGTETFIREHLGQQTGDVSVTEREFVFRYLSPEHWLDVFTTWYGPTLKAFEGAAASDVLRDDVLALIARHNTATDGSMRVPSAYLEAVVRR